MHGLIHSHITATQNRDLLAIPMGRDIRSTIMDMGHFKSPGPDGMTVVFYKTYWAIVGPTVIQAIHDVFQTRQLPPSFNSTFLALIPKTAHACRVDHFRPISLCNVVFKVITKLIVGRLRGLLETIIHPSQAAFIPHRSIGDNSIINHEVMHYLNGKHGKHGYMAIKIDLAKAYDRVEWTPLLHILKLLGFSQEFRDLIFACISTPKFSVLLNAAPYGYFSSQRGLRQGDPMSPALFTILADLLSRLLAREEVVGRLNGVKVSRSSPKITYLMYADDLVIYCQAKLEEAVVVKRCLQHYSDWTGQEINFSKSSIHFSRNVNRRLRRDLCHVLCLSECDHTGNTSGFLIALLNHELPRLRMWLNALYIAFRVGKVVLFHWWTCCPYSFCRPSNPGLCYANLPTA